MQLTLVHHGFTFAVTLDAAKSIAIPLDFEGSQPNHFGAEKAKTTVLKLGEFTGDTKLGGSCNVDSLQMIPHCNGTHTETVSHIVNEEIWVGHAAMGILAVAMLVTVKPVAAETTESYRPPLESSDVIITRRLLTESLSQMDEGNPDWKQIRPDALIIRTLPNSVDKCSRAYTAEKSPPFFTVEAMALINELGVRHLLVDFPSVDRMYDDGLLTNHHIFWNVNEKSHELSGETWQDKTITEMVFVDDEITDGVCVLNLQIPAFCSDAAPSRPVILPAVRVS